MPIVTDFAPPAPARSLWGPTLGVCGTLFASLALGFTEGCLEIARRPIPLRFALRFAVANVLPSAVWRSVSARHVAAASGVPLSALISNEVIESPRSVTMAKRLVLVQSVQALRMVVGSYGLAWSLWCWYKTDSMHRHYDKQEVVKDVESVVRLAPVNSPLSRASRRNHADHIVIVPMNNEDGIQQEESNTLDWTKVGIDVKLKRERDQEERVKVIEVEVSHVETTVASARRLKAQVSSGDNSLVYAIAVLSPYEEPLPTSRMDTFDVCFNPLSAVLTFIASICHDRGEKHVFLVADQETGGEAEDVVGRDADTSRQRLSTSLLATGLLYRHGITTSVVKTQEVEPVNDHVRGEATADNAMDTNSGVVFFIAKSLGAGQTIARKLIKQGIVMQEKACFIVEESLCNQSALSEQCQAQSALLERAKRDVEVGPELATNFSVADVSDQTLQGIRELLRQKETPDTIQAVLYRAYGTQRVVVPTRPDLFSDLDL